MVKAQDFLTNIVTLSSMSEVVYRVIKEIAGNDISTTINGSDLSREIVSNLVYQRTLTSSLDKITKGAVV